MTINRKPVEANSANTTRLAPLSWARSTKPRVPGPSVVAAEPEGDDQDQRQRDQHDEDALGATPPQLPADLGPQRQRAGCAVGRRRSPDASWSAADRRVVRGPTRLMKTSSSWRWPSTESTRSRPRPVRPPARGRGIAPVHPDQLAVARRVAARARPAPRGRARSSGVGQPDQGDVVGRGQLGHRRRSGSPCPGASPPRGCRSARTSASRWLDTTTVRPVAA